MIISKAFTPQTIYERDGKAYAEGWIATPDKDTENDSSPPEAFMNSLDGYFERGAPVSYIHDRQTLPAGHMQKAILVRDGTILKSAIHPVDPAEFEAFPGKGTGWYGRVVIEDRLPAMKIKSGSVRSFSFTGKAAKKEALPGGRYRYLEINPLMESTVAPYPINPKATMIIAKAHGETTPMDPEAITALVSEILSKREAEKAIEVKKASDEAALTSILEKMTALEAKNRELEETIQKAQVPNREEGTGRKQAAPSDEDPIDYIQKAILKKEALSLEDKNLLASLTVAYFTNGMTE